MRRYLVMWEMEFDAESHEDAALKALVIQRDGSSIATVFDVIEFDSKEGARRVDLEEVCGG